jgi:hypothetical protein
MKRGRIVKPMLEISVSNEYDEAKKEWRITGNVWNGAPVSHPSNHPYRCLCGHAIHWHFEIENTENGLIEIVGSDCVENWMVYRHLTETKKVNPAEVTEEKIKEWLESMVNELKAEAWFRMQGDLFNTIYEAIKDIDLRVNTKVKNTYYDSKTDRWEKRLILRKRATGKPIDANYKMASIIWRWNHPDNPKTQMIRYGFPNDRLWADMLMFYTKWKDKLDLIEQEESERARRIIEIEQRREERLRVCKEMREDIDDIDFIESCEYYGIEPFAILDGKNNWEQSFLRDMITRMTNKQELTERQFETLRKILLGNARAATEKQIAYLRKLGVEDIPDDLTVKQASDLINEVN